MCKINNNCDLAPAILDELNYKIWATKESRFNAYHRLLKQSKASRRCQQILFVYYLALVFGAFYSFGVTPLFNDTNIVILIITSSVFLVAFGRIENTKTYRLKAAEFHTSGIELSCLYNVLKIFSSLIENQPVESKKEFADKITTSYHRILEMHHHHEPIDAELFKLKAAYYHNLNWFEVQKININYYFKTSLRYHLLVIFPPLILVLLYNQ